jgi:quercetin dioxygenase-like cupin family protein
VEFPRRIGLARNGAGQLDRQSEQGGSLHITPQISPPHFHPDAREVTVLSGVWYTGYGETADAAKLKALPAGSFYTEPANEPHYVEVREPTVIQVSGIGPSGRKDVAAVAPK